MSFICLQCYIVLQLNWKLRNQISLHGINEFVLCGKIWILFIFWLFIVYYANGRKYPHSRVWAFTMLKFEVCLLCFRNLILETLVFIFTLAYPCLFHPLKFWIGLVHVPVDMPSSLFFKRSFRKFPLQWLPFLCWELRMWAIRSWKAVRPSRKWRPVWFKWRIASKNVLWIDFLTFSSINWIINN